MLLMSISRTSLIMAEEKFKMADLLRFVAIYVNNLTLWARRDTLISSSRILLFKFVMHVTYKQFSYKFNNG